MSANEQIDRLNRRLRSQSLGPVSIVSDQIFGSLASALQVLATWLRDVARDQPLITLLLSIEAGYAVARLRRRHARR
jgi:uncharacterized membrane protein